MKTINLILIMMMVKLSVFAQHSPSSLSLWKLTSVSGEVTAKGFYRELESKRSNISEFNKSTLLSGGILLKTKSYILHPKFLILNTDGEYSPETAQNQYISIPSQSEVRTLKKLNLGASLFQNSPLTISSFYNFAEGINNRESLTNIKTSTRNIGSAISYNNKFMPAYFSYDNRKWDYQELGTDRLVNFQQNTFQGRINKSFRKSDTHVLNYTHDQFNRKDEFLTPSQTRTDNVQLSSNVYLDTLGKYKLTSSVSGYNQTGAIDLKRYDISESLLLKLPHNLDFTGSYNYNNDMQESHNMFQHVMLGRLGHQLYKSLFTHVSLGKDIISHSSFDASNTRSGLDVLYTKLIPADGRLSVGYGISSQFNSVQSSDVVLQIRGERLMLTDGQIVLLNRPFVIISSIVVRDLTGTIIYQKNTDYVLVTRNKFIEVQRVPGGLISNGMTVFVDYEANQPGTYQYNLISNNISADITLFKSLFKIYYQTAWQDYTKTKQIDFLPLSFLNQNIYGVQLDYKHVNTGFEYTEYNNSIIPYHLQRYYLLLNGNVKQKLLCAVNGSYSRHEFIDEGTVQDYTNITGFITYILKGVTSIGFESGYQNQVGREINLNLLTFKNQVQTSYRQLYFLLTLETYTREYSLEKIQFKSIKAQISRRF